MEDHWTYSIERGHRDQMCHKRGIKISPGPAPRSMLDQIDTIPSAFK